MQREDYSLVANAFTEDYANLYKLKQVLACSRDIDVVTKVSNIKDRWAPLATRRNLNISVEMTPDDVDVVMAMMDDVSNNFFGRISSSLSLLSAMLPEADYVELITRGQNEVNAALKSAADTASLKFDKLLNTFPRANLIKRHDNDAPDAVVSRAKINDAVQVEGLDPASSTFVKASTSILGNQRAPTILPTPFVGGMLRQDTGQIGGVTWVTGSWNEQGGLMPFELKQGVNCDWSTSIVSTYAAGAARNAERKINLCEYKVACNVYVEVQIDPTDFLVHTNNNAVVGYLIATDPEFATNAAGAVAARGERLRWLSIKSGANYIPLTVGDVQGNRLICSAMVPVAAGTTIALSMRGDLAAFAAAGAAYAGSGLMCHVMGDVATTKDRAIDNISALLGNLNAVGNVDEFIDLPAIDRMFEYFRQFNAFVFGRTGGTKEFFQRTIDFALARGVVISVDDILSMHWWVQNLAAMSQATLLQLWNVFYEQACDAKALMLTDHNFLVHVA